MKLLTAKEAVQYLRISLFTLGRIEKEGLLVPFRTPGGHRRYSPEMLNEYLEHSRARPEGWEKRILVVDDGEELLDLLTHTFPSCRFSSAGDILNVGMKLAEFKPQILVVNVGMSGLDTSELCRRLDGQANQLQVLPFELPQEGEEGGRKTGLDLSGLAVLKERIEHLLGDRSRGESSDV